MKSDMLVGGHNGDDVSCNRTAVAPPLAPHTQHRREKPVKKTIIYFNICGSMHHALVVK